MCKNHIKLSCCNSDYNCTIRRESNRWSPVLGIAYKTLYYMQRLWCKTRKTSTFPISMKSRRNIWHAWRKTVTLSWQYCSNTRLLSKTLSFCVSYHDRNSLLSDSLISSTPYCSLSGMGPTIFIFALVLKRWGTMIWLLKVRMLLVVYAAP